MRLLSTFLGCLLTVGLLTACTAQVRSGGPGPAPRGQSDVRHLHSVPFYPDESDQGGPSTLASVLTYWGFHTEPLALKEEIYMSRFGGAVSGPSGPDRPLAGPEQAGTRPMDLLLAAQARGLRAQSYGGTLENLKIEIKAGHPLVALMDLAHATVGPRLSGQYSAGQYVVIIGFDDRRQGVYLHSGLQRDTFVPYKRFMQAWEKTGRWVLLVLPPSMQGRNRI
jgi:hypothetical protein